MNCGKRKRPRHSRNNVCFQWKKIGTCTFSDGCRFSHDVRVDECADDHGVDSQEQGRDLNKKATFNQESGGAEDRQTRDQSTQELVDYPNGVPKPVRSIDKACKRYYFVQPQTSVSDENCEDMVLLVHFNGIRICSLAPSHSVLVDNNGQMRDKDYVKKVEYCTVGGESLKSISLSGKKKRGAIRIGKGQPICQVVCKDEKKYTILSCISGRIVEINRQLLSSPSLLLSQGYIAVFDVDKTQSNYVNHTTVLDEHEYCKLRAEK